VIAQAKRKRKEKEKKTLKVEIISVTENFCFFLSVEEGFPCFCGCYIQARTDNPVVPEVMAAFCILVFFKKITFGHLENVFQNLDCGGRRRDSRRRGNTSWCREPWRRDP
jgi:hypothetical protein